MKKKILIPTIAAALIAATTFKLLSNKKDVESNIYRLDTEKRILVQADTVSPAGLSRTFSYTGTFTPEKEVTIIPQVRGDVTAVYFNEGDKVFAGKQLLQIDDELLQAQLISVEANYEIAKRNLERYESASQSGGISALQLDNYRLNLKNAESQRKQLAKQIRLSKVVAPFSGTITFKDVEPGALAGSTAVARITDLSTLRLEISVPETEVQFFKEGHAMHIETNSNEGNTIDGVIDYVSDRTDQSHNYTVKVRAKNKFTNIKAGMYGTAHLTITRENESITIPRAALTGSAKNPKVFVLKNGVANLTSIKTGVSNGEAIEVIEGIAPGEVVVTGGQINLVSGSKVQVAN